MRYFPSAIILSVFLLYVITGISFEAFANPQMAKQQFVLSIKEIALCDQLPAPQKLNQVLKIDCIPKNFTDSKAYEPKTSAALKSVSLNRCGTLNLYPNRPSITLSEADIRTNFRVENKEPKEMELTLIAEQPHCNILFTFLPENTSAVQSISFIWKSKAVTGK